MRRPSWTKKAIGKHTIKTRLHKLDRKPLQNIPSFHGEVVFTSEFVQFSALLDRVTLRDVQNAPCLAIDGLLTVKDKSSRSDGVRLRVRTLSDIGFARRLFVRVQLNSDGRPKA